MAEFTMYENGRLMACRPKTFDEFWKIVGGMDYAMACVDAPTNTYVLENDLGRAVLERPGSSL